MYALRKEPLHPVADVSADNRFDMVLINKRVLITDSIPVSSVFTGSDNDRLVRKADP